MGCDIHIQVEYKKHNTVQWCAGNFYKRNKYFGTDPEEPEFVKMSLKSESRNYNLFAVLADVRSNYSSKPICRPRGAPDDMSKETFVVLGKWAGDAHSTSYFTLDELLEVQKEYSPVLDDLIEELTYLKKTIDYGIETIRIIFWFDN